MTRLVMSGNYAQSYAALLARVQVVSAYPITPQTSIVEKLADFVASGKLKAEYIQVESEHSALQVVVSAAGLGARTYTATSSQGLLLMHELLHWASGMRAPIVMGVVNRAVAPPWNIGADHTDTMAQRDTGWVQIYCREQPGGPRHRPPVLPARGGPDGAAAGHGHGGRLLPFPHRRAGRRPQRRAWSTASSLPEMRVRS